MKGEITMKQKTVEVRPGFKIKQLSNGQMVKNVKQEIKKSKAKIYGGHFPEKN